ncbi:hypothetical protein VNI00_003143 [Paramarasmius palmivorus]|uniref:Uncharacterized protein n=1 Tax=Paramarasmius palmivorus TaxID=297713 RepID=A0AAW0DRP5_9AGAR
MPFIRCRTFLACLPLASGVWVLGLLGLIVGGAGAAAGWIKVALLDKHPLPVQDVVSIFVNAITFSLLALFSLIGVVAGFAKKHGLAVFYKRMIALQYVLMIAALAYSFYSTFRPIDDSVVERCRGDSEDEMVLQLCAKGFSLVKGFCIFLFAFALLVQFYAYVLVSNFAYKLDLEDIAGVRRTMAFPDDFKKAGNGYGPPYLPYDYQSSRAV